MTCPRTPRASARRHRRSDDLSVIDAGFGRTGTLSLKAALERLGHGPCYHMIEILTAPERARHWLEQAQSGSHDWDTIFRGYRATVDWPAAACWRELADRYPDAEVVLSRRNADRWVDSMTDTILPMMTREPLCRFLGVPVPGEEFPHLNDTAWYRSHMGLPALDPDR